MSSSVIEAFRYTIRELGRRAGAECDWIATWRISFDNDHVSLYPQNDSAVRLVFPFDPSKIKRFSLLQDLPPRRYTWMDNPGTSILQEIPDFIVPFDENDRDGLPAFTVVDPEVIECRADILTASLFMLSRMEEALSGQRDVHGRFPASASMAHRFGFLDRPIVDEYGLAVRQALTRIIPNWSPTRPNFRVKLSHDIDSTGFPRNLRSTVGHLYPRRLPKAFVQDALAFVGIGRPAYLESVLTTVRISQKNALDSAFYWKASARSPWDTGYNPQDAPIRLVISELIKSGFEMGIHPAYNTFGDLNSLQAEVDRLRRILGTGPLGGRQHFLRWLPSTWIDWERAGLAYDSSVGFADMIGFRAGTAVPYHPWILDEGRESTLLEIPLLVMDCTPVKYMSLQDTDILASVGRIVRQCDVVGGVFTLLWHNSSVLEHPYASLYPKILSLLPPSSPYDWRADLKMFPLPRLLETVQP